MSGRISGSLGDEELGQVHSLSVRVLRSFLKVSMTGNAVGSSEFWVLVFYELSALLSGISQYSLIPGFLLTQSRKLQAQNWFHVYWLMFFQSRGAIKREIWWLTKWSHAVFLRLFFSWKGTDVLTHTHIPMFNHMHTLGHITHTTRTLITHIPTHIHTYAYQHTCTHVCTHVQTHPGW